jgi:hypothetical protein
MKFKLLKPILAFSLVIGALCAALSFTQRSAKAIGVVAYYQCTCGCGMTWPINMPDDPKPSCCAGDVVMLP